MSDSLILSYRKLHLSEGRILFYLKNIAGDDKIYRIASNNFVIPYGGDDFKKVITWYKPRNLVDYGDFRDKVIEFLKVIPKIQTKKLIDEDNKRLRVYPVVPVTEKKNLREEIA